MNAGTLSTGHEVIVYPSEWVKRWASYIPRKARVLDVACGGGRHARLLARLGHGVDAVDRDISRMSASGSADIQVLEYDLEAQPWPYPPGAYGGVVVTNYLYRPLLPTLIEALAPGGVLIYETFAEGNERFGRPSSPDYLLRPGELLEVVRGQLRVLGYEDIYVSKPKPACVQRICAIKPELAVEERQQ